jgi:hypothetical protein
MGGVREESEELQRTCRKCKCKETGKKTIKDKCPTWVDCVWADGEYHNPKKSYEED